jgi:hypothetical protein
MEPFDLLRIWVRERECLHIDDHGGERTADPTWGEHSWEVLESRPEGGSDDHQL